MALIHYYRIIRPMNAFMVSMMAVSGIWFAAGFQIEWWKYPLAVIVAVTYIGIAMVHNDIIDLEIDKINAPERPIPSGNITIKQAKIYTVILFIIGTSAGVFMQIESIVLMALSLVLSLMYNAYLKKTGFLGNITVGITATSAFLYGDAVGTGFLNFWPVDNWNPSIYLFLISALLNTAREVSKGIMDTEGDEKHGVRTIAVLFGKKAAAVVVAVILAIALGFAILPIIYEIFGPIYIIALLTFFILILQVTYPLLKDPNYDAAKNFKKRIILIMLLALIIILIDVQVQKTFSFW
ncbi:MAG: geranylgeranylglycerol-phosphate geranylgeranyltransferase [Candidatus Heimdallarchaeota archaeon]|nr:geranylgeranylglycerol-phosphate geranylgeranyltransferase [Candidatus Heimdallarchaeota archaeon]